jgi:catechol 2,3-dioxygenase-like lactoylglutathione lyase family enzyme
MKITNSNVTINVLDLDSSIEFYKSIGLELKNRWGNYYAQLKAPNLLIGLHPTKENELLKNSGNVSIGFTTDNFDSARSMLKKLLIKFDERKEEGGEFLHFKDPNGTALYFIKPKW